MSKFKEWIFPQHKKYADLEEPIQSMLAGKAMIGIVAIIAMIALLFTRFDWQMKILGEVMLFVFLLTIVHVWWLFLTDSVMSLEATYNNRAEIDESNNGILKATSKARHRFYSRRIFLVKDGQKFEVFVKSYDDSMEKGDIVKLYTTPNNVYTKNNGVMRINSVLALFVTESKVNMEEKEDNDEEE